LSKNRPWYLSFLRSSFFSLNYLISFIWFIKSYFRKKPHHFVKLIFQAKKDAAVFFLFDACFWIFCFELRDFFHKMRFFFFFFFTSFHSVIPQQSYTGSQFGHLIEVQMMWDCSLTNKQTQLSCSWRFFFAVLCPLLLPPAPTISKNTKQHQGSSLDPNFYTSACLTPPQSMLSHSNFKSLPSEIPLQKVNLKFISSSFFVFTVENIPNGKIIKVLRYTFELSKSQLNRQMQQKPLK